MKHRPTIRTMGWVIAAAVAATVGAGCGDDGRDLPQDAGEPRADTGAADSGPGPEDGGAAEDAAGMDAALDAGAPVDAGYDAGEPVDAAGLVADGGILDCVGAELPATADTVITVSGTVQSLSAAGTSPIDGALLEVFEEPDDTLLTSSTSNADGSFAVSLDNPDETPMQAYLRASADGHVITYLFPPYPMREDFDNALVGMVTPATWDFLPTLARASQTEGNGIVAVLVVDCYGEGVAGATVSSDPPTEDIGYSNDSMLPTTRRSQTADDGLAYLFDVPPGEITVDAELAGISLREHTVRVFANRLTTTLVLP